MQRGAAEPTQRLAPGTRLGRYAIVEPLGAGGMGVVYRARDEKLERVAAIKMLAPGVLSGDEARRLFRREALALAKLNHPHTLFQKIHRKFSTMTIALVFLY